MPSPTSVFFGLGSNLQNPVEQLHRGLQALRERIGDWDFQASGFVKTPPMGGMDQPDYVNCVCSLVTELEPLDLLRQVQAIEDEHGRERKVRWGPRTLDIDILLYGNLVVEWNDLTLPHPGMDERDFVLQPLLQIAPDLCRPDGVPYRDLLAPLLSDSKLVEIHEDR